MSCYTRCDILKILSMAIPGTLLNCSKKDFFEDERVAFTSLIMI